MNMLKCCNFVDVKTLTSTGSTDTSYGNQLDMQGYDGVVYLCKFTNNSGTGITMIAQGSTTSGSGDQNYANATVASTVAAGCLVIDLYRPTMRYTRPSILIAATNVMCSGITAIQYSGSKFPISQGSTSVLDSTLVAGATT